MAVIPMKYKSNELIPNFKPFIPQESIDRVIQTLNSSWIGGDGPRVREFENKIAKIIKNSNVLAVNSGTSALQLALRLVGTKDGEVITSPMTCFATNAAIMMEGGRPVWVDIDPETGNIDPSQIAKKITKKTKAIMVIHWGGSPVDLDEISQISKKYNLPVIEDASQALGSEYDKSPIGSHSDFVAFSFQAIKIINTADGGLLATRKASDTKRGKTLRWYGIDRDARTWQDHYTFWEYPIAEISTKMQLTDLNASIGLGQLPYLKKHLQHRRKLAKLYEQALSGNNNLNSQKIYPKAKPNYWLFTVICKNKTAKQKLWRRLNQIGVKAEEAHRRNDLYPVFFKFKSKSLPGVIYFNDNHLVIPIGHWVSEQKASEIAEVLARS